jgi:hypothetical protein
VRQHKRERGRHEGRCTEIGRVSGWESKLVRDANEKAGRWSCVRTIKERMDLRVLATSLKLTELSSERLKRVYYEVTEKNNL